ncbi:MAG: hypothetical protein PVG70_20965 [Desulfobacterales bacterium]
MAAAADEQLTQVLDDDQQGCADELPNITNGKSGMGVCVWGSCSSFSLLS